MVREASPITYVRVDAPPVLLMHGRDDRLIPCAQSERLHAALAAVGAQTQLETYPGADHMWLGSSEAPGLALAGTIAFLRHTL